MTLSALAYHAAASTGVIWGGFGMLAVLSDCRPMVTTPVGPESILLRTATESVADVVPSPPAGRSHDRQLATARSGSRRRGMPVLYDSCTFRE